MNLRQQILQALEQTKHFNADYWQKTLLQRAGIYNDGSVNDRRAGSYYPDLSPNTLNQYLEQAYWEETFSSNVRSGFRTFITPLSGILGIVPLEQLSPQQTVRISDPKNTGFASLTVQSDKEIFSDHTTLLISEKSVNWKVITFYPGDPIEGQRISMQSLQQKKITVRDALDLGFKHAKVTKT